MSNLFVTSRVENFDDLDEIKLDVLKVVKPNKNPYVIRNANIV